MEKGQRGPEQLLWAEVRPCQQQMGGATLKTTPKTTRETLQVHLSWEGNQDPSYSSPKTSRGMGNNGFSFLPCAAKMERQVESGVGLQVRRPLLVPALQMTSFQQTGWNSSSGMPGSATGIFGSVFPFGWMGRFQQQNPTTRPRPQGTAGSPHQINSGNSTNPWVGRELPEVPKPRFQQELAPAPLQCGVFPRNLQESHSQTPRISALPRWQGGKFSH